MNHQLTTSRETTVVFPITSYYSKTCTGIFLILFLAGCKPAAVIPLDTPSPIPAANCTAGDHVEELTSGGRLRRYRLHVPPTYQPEKPAALVLGFHGNTGHAEVFESYSGFSTLADRAGYIAVYPQGAGNPPTWEIWQGSKDVQFIRDLISRLETECDLDPARIYATGHSLGGGMVNRLACDLADSLAAIAPVSGYYQYAEECSPSRPVAVVAFHATGDEQVPYNGFPDISNGPPENFFTIGVPIPQWASSWAVRNGCSAKPTIVYQNQQVTGQGWSDCREGANVVFYTINGGRHRWPPEMDTTETIWDFFARHYGFDRSASP